MATNKTPQILQPVWKNPNLPPIIQPQPLTPKKREGFFAKNTTGYDLLPGYLVAVTGYDHNKQMFTIERPTEDNMERVAVVLKHTPDNEYLNVPLAFDGVHDVIWSGDKPEAGDTIGTQADSFLGKKGNRGFVVLGDGIEDWLYNTDPEVKINKVRVQFPAGRPGNLHADDAENAFTIDRTDEADDEKAWNPGADEPEDWADYDCVKLVMGFLRYDSTAGTLKHVKQELHWHAANAPIIPAADVADADVGICDSEEEGEEEPPA